jgi:2,5-diketo-D-gluconate reductase B
MQYLTLSTGARMPRLGFGTWQIDNADVGACIHKALEIGYRHIDTAVGYNNEAGIGTALAQAGIPRNELFITTKIRRDDVGAADLLRTADESLERLQTDYVDLLLLHWPNNSIPLEESIEAINQVFAAGKTKAIGISNYNVALMQQAIELSKAPIVNNQIEYHALLNQDKVIEFARANNIAITAYSPLARAALRDNPVLIEIGANYGKSASQVALRWLLDQEGVVVIPKASSETNMRANFEIFDFTLSSEERQRIAALANNTRLVNPPWPVEWD